MLHNYPETHSLDDSVATRILDAKLINTNQTVLIIGFVKQNTVDDPH